MAASAGASSTASRRSSCREVIHIQVGKSGCKYGHEFWRDLCEEHKVQYRSEVDRGRFGATSRGLGNGNSADVDDFNREEHLDVFFNEGSNHRYVPRAILVDLNMLDLAQITATPLGDLYRPENIIGNDEGAGNCYAKAFHTEGPDLADQVLENVRKEAERCNCLQGIQFCHSVCGGTGSGLTGLIMKVLKDYLDKGSKCIFQNFCLVPGPGVSDLNLEVYNAALGIMDLVEHSDQVFLYDNAALMGICSKTLEVEVPPMDLINNTIGLTMSGITAPLRFTGPLNTDLQKMHTNLVPFKNGHFLINGFAPLTAEPVKKYRKAGNVLDLAQQMISKDSVTVSCDPLFPGQTGAAPRARFLASLACWRGWMKSREVDEILFGLQKPGSRFDKFFPDWIPNSIASSLCKVPHIELGESVCFTANSTAIHQVFDRISREWDSMHKARSFLHFYTQDGISDADMKESRTWLQYLSDQYTQWAHWEDKVLNDNYKVNDAAVTNGEQALLASEMAELKDGSQWVEYRRREPERPGQPGPPGPPGPPGRRG